MISAMRLQQYIKDDRVRSFYLALQGDRCYHGRIQSLQELCGSENPDIIAVRSFSTETCAQEIIAENE
jgi:hypothetical protein